MGSRPKEEAWIIDKRGMGGTGVEGSFRYSVVPGATRPVKGAR